MTAADKQPMERAAPATDGMSCTSSHHQN